MLIKKSALSTTHLFHVLILITEFRLLLIQQHLLSLDDLLMNRLALLQILLRLEKVLPDFDHVGLRAGSVRAHRAVLRRGCRESMIVNVVVKLGFVPV